MRDLDDLEFRATIAMLIPAILHVVAYHPESPRLVQRLSDLGDALDRPERIEYVSWEISRVIARIAKQQPKGVRLHAAEQTPDGGTREIPIDDADPVLRSVVRHGLSAINDDRIMAQAVFAAIPEVDQDLFLRLLIANAGRAVRESGTGRCQR